MKVEFLQWDSEFFGLKIGKVVILNNNQFDEGLFLQEAVTKHYDLIYVFSLQQILQSTNILELVDIQLTMSMPSLTNNTNSFPFELKTALTEIEKNECYEIAEEIAIYSRFYNEKLIGPEPTKRLYRKWIDNALNKTFSDGIFVKKINNKIEGLHIIKTDLINKCGYFTLTGVNPNLKGNGIGKELWDSSFEYWLKNSNIEFIKSPFSLQNINSFNFHLKMGFKKTEEVKYIYHYRNINKYL